MANQIRAAARPGRVLRVAPGMQAPWQTDRNGIRAFLSRLSSGPVRLRWIGSGYPRKGLERASRPVGSGYARVRTTDAASAWHCCDNLRKLAPGWFSNTAGRPRRITSIPESRAARVGDLRGQPGSVRRSDRVQGL